MKHNYIIVNEDKVFSGISPSGRLLWEDLDTEEPIQVVLFTTNDQEQIPGLPDTAHKVSLTPVV